MRVPFLDLAQVHSNDLKQLSETASKVLQNGWYVLGNEVEAFEKEWAAYCESPYCIGTASGLDAIELILRAKEYQNGSEILVPSNTYFATILGILRAGLVPVLVEPSHQNFLVSAVSYEKKISANTKAIFHVELYGEPGDYDTLHAICLNYGLDLFSDNAQSHGALYKKKSTATFAAAVAYSFYPSKNLGAMGDAGAVVCQDKELAEKIKALRNYGSNKKYSFKYTGLNSRLDELQAAFLRVKLKNLNLDLKRRREIAKMYLEGIRNSLITLPECSDPDSHSWHLFVIQTKERDKLKNFLAANEIGTDIHYPIPPHKQEALKNWDFGELPVAERLHNSVLSLPLNTTLSNEQINFVINTINSF